MSWNCKHASSTSRLWNYLLELDSDVALLQDFGTVPEHILQRRYCPLLRRCPPSVETLSP